MGKVNVELTEESVKFLQELAKEIRTQDSLCTAKPYFFGCRVVREYPVPDGYGGDKTYYLDKYGQGFDSKEELLENYPEHEDYLIKEVQVKFHKEVDNVFLTKKGYDQHLMLNRHNLRSPDAFLFHAFRNPEFDNLFKAIAEFDNLQPVKCLLELK